MTVRANSSVLSRLLNVSSDGDDVTVAGKLFHTRAAAIGKAQSPTVDKREEGTLSASVNDERRRRYTLEVTGEIRRG